MMNNSEQIKTAVDNFGRLSFILETYVKLVQTGDHPDIAQDLLQAAIQDSTELHKSLIEIKESTYVQA